MNAKKANELSKKSLWGAKGLPILEMIYILIEKEAKRGEFSLFFCFDDFRIPNDWRIHTLVCNSLREEGFTVKPVRFGQIKPEFNISW